MRVGISSASLFMRENNEDCFEVFRKLGADICEIFLTTFSEYTKSFGEILKKNKGNVEVHSIHVLNTNYEPQLYSNHPRVIEDAFYWLNNVMDVGQLLDAKYYTFHGVARLKKTALNVNFEDIGQKTNKIIETCRSKNISLALENVHWAYYNQPGFFANLKTYSPELKGVLDFKQALQSGFDAKDYILEMKEDIVTVHLSDYDENGKLCLPGKGVLDFEKYFEIIKDVGASPVFLIEVYNENYKTYDELEESVEFVKNLLL